MPRIKIVPETIAGRKRFFVEVRNGLDILDDSNWDFEHEALKRKMEIMNEKTS